MVELASAPRLVEQVFDALVDEMVEGKLPPGSRLIQDDIAAGYGVSRQPVQQALHLLRLHGLISDAPRRGYVVKPLDVGFIAHLYEIRAALEALAARRAAGQGRERAAADGPALIEQGRQAIAKKQLAEEIKADIDFHDFIYGLSGNPLILDTVRQQRHHLRRVMAAVLRDDTRIPGAVWDEHAAILAAIADGDERRAECLAREHVERAAGIFIGRLRMQQDTDAAAQRARSRRRLLVSR